MSMEEQITSHIGVIIIVIVVLIFIFYILNSFTEGGLVRAVVCGVLFWLPFGAAVAKHCRAIPV